MVVPTVFVTVKMLAKLLENRMINARAETLTIKQGNQAGASIATPDIRCALARRAVVRQQCFSAIRPGQGFPRQENLCRRSKGEWIR